MNVIFFCFSGVIFIFSTLSYVLMDWEFTYSVGFLLHKNGQEVSMIQAALILLGGKSVLPTIISLSGAALVVSFCFFLGKARGDIGKRNKPIVVNDFTFPEAFLCPECGFRIATNESDRKNFEIVCNSCSTRIFAYELQRSTDSR